MAIATTGTTVSLTTVIAATVILATFYCASAQAPVPAPAPFAAGPVAEGPTSTDCFTTLLNMSDCLSYVEEGSNLTVPDKPCCPELAGLVESSPLCLCELLSDPKKVGLNIEVEKALKLPSVCSVTTPPVSACAVLGFPVAGPAGSEVAPGAQPPQAFASTPSNGNNGNDASSIARFSVAFMICLAISFLPIFH